MHTRRLARILLDWRRPRLLNPFITPTAVAFQGMGSDNKNNACLRCVAFRCVAFRCVALHYSSSLCRILSLRHRSFSIRQRSFSDGVFFGQGFLDSGRKRPLPPSISPAPLESRQRFFSDADFFLQRFFSDADFLNAPHLRPPFAPSCPRTAGTRVRVIINTKATTRSPRRRQQRREKDCRWVIVTGSKFCSFVAVFFF